MARILDLLPPDLPMTGHLPERRHVARRQLPFFLGTLLMYTAVVFTNAGLLGNGWVQAVLAANVVLLALCALVPWERLPSVLPLVIPVLDLLLVGLMRAEMGPHLSIVEGLVVFPVIWLAVSGRLSWAAVPLGCLLALGVLWAGHRASGEEMTNEARVRLVLISLILLGLGYTVQIITTRLRRQEEQLRRVVAEGARRERLLDAVLDTAQVGIVAFDTNGQITLMNREQRRMHELALPEGTKEGIEPDLMIRADADGTPLPIPDRPGARALRGEAFSGQLVWIGRDPDQRVLSGSARPMRDEHGHTEGAVLSLNDVTDLVAALQAKDEFLAGVTHELRTPLTSIRGYTELLAMGEDLPDDVRGGLEVIERNAEQLSTLIDDLLGTGTAAGDLHPASTDLVEVVRQSVAAAELRAVGAGIDLSVDVPRRLVVDCDPVRIGQVLDNLISNAIKYSPDGGAVTVRAARSSGEALCQVTDRGLGISAEDARHVFDRFFRGPAVRSSGIPGLGLGLTIAREIVEQHRGTLTCRSAVGEGTTFTVALPLGDPDSDRCTDAPGAVAHSTASSATAP